LLLWGALATVVAGLPEWDMSLALRTAPILVGAVLAGALPAKSLRPAAVAGPRRCFAPSMLACTAMGMWIAALDSADIALSMTNDY
jgi:hypothetical protein